MSTSWAEKVREMCAFSQASSVVAAPFARQYPVASACVAEVRPMTGDPGGNAGRFASRTAPGGDTNFPRIALASAAARCFGVVDGLLIGRNASGFRGGGLCRRGYLRRTLPPALGPG